MDYRGSNQDEKLSKARLHSYPIGFDTGIQLFKEGQFAVGHFDFSGRNKKLLKDFKVVLAVRRCSDCLASFMHFQAIRIKLNPHRLPADKAEWVSYDASQEQFVGYLNENKPNTPRE